MLIASLAILGCDQPPPVSTEVSTVPPVTIPADAKLSYRLSFDDRAQHYVDIEAVVPVTGGPLELMMAVWTPGSYLVREYSRQVEALSASTPAGAPLEVRKTSKNRWQVDPSVGDGSEDGDESAVLVRYRLYCREMSVRTNFVDHDLAILNGAPTFIVPVRSLDAPLEVSLKLPENWPDAATALDRHPSGDTHRYVAADFDTLVDSPIVAGELDRRTFVINSGVVDGVEHEIVHLGDLTGWDFEQTLADVETLTRAQIDFWGVIPYRRYLFQNAIVNAGGGLEHHESTLMLTTARRTGVREEYVRWLGLVSHELFHAWNVKKLRPEALGPFDYENEVYTPSLWIAEGLTSYFDTLLLRRAGLIDDDELLGDMSKSIERLERTEGRRVRSLSDASFDAWIKQYRPDENSRNTNISYYTKGLVVGWLLDVEIQRRSGGKRTLDDVMREAYARFSGERGFSADAFRDLASELAGHDLSDFWERYVDGTEDLDYGAALEHLGLRFEPAAEPEEGDDPPPGWLGFESDASNGRMVVAGIPRGTPAYDHGVNAGDEILAIDGYRIPHSGLEQITKRFAPGTEVELLISRRGRLRTLSIVLGEEPKETWTLEVVDKPTAAQQRRYREWTSAD